MAQVSNWDHTAEAKTEVSEIYSISNADSRATPKSRLLGDLSIYTVVLGVPQLSFPNL